MWGHEHVCACMGQGESPFLSARRTVDSQLTKCRVVFTEEYRIQIVLYIKHSCPHAQSPRYCAIFALVQSQGGVSTRMKSLCLVLLLASAAGGARASDDLIAFTAESSIFRNGPRNSTLIALVRPKASPHSVFFHPTLHAVRAQLSDLGMPKSVGYVDLDDPLCARLSKTFAVRTLPTLLLFLEHAPNPVRIEYALDKTPEDYVFEVLSLSLRTKPLTALPRLPPVSVAAVAGNATSASVSVAGEVEGSDAPPSLLTQACASAAKQLDRQVELTDIVRRRMELTKDAVGDVSRRGSSFAAQGFNSARNLLLARGDMVDVAALHTALETLGTLGQFLPST